MIFSQEVFGTVPQIVSPTCCYCAPQSDTAYLGDFEA